MGLAATATIWVIILITEPYSRWMGLGWMALGLAVYYVMKKRRKRPYEEWEIKLPRHMGNG